MHGRIWKGGRIIATAWITAPYFRCQYSCSYGFGCGVLLVRAIHCGGRGRAFAVSIVCQGGGPEGGELTLLADIMCSGSCDDECLSGKVRGFGHVQVSMGQLGAQVAQAAPVQLSRTGRNWSASCQSAAGCPVQEEGKGSFAVFRGVGSCPSSY